MLTFCIMIFLALPISAPLTRAAAVNYGSPSLSQSPPRIAVVKPIFTATAYDNAFYVFYAKYGSSNQTYIQTDLKFLNVTVKQEWGGSISLSIFLASERARRYGLVRDESFTIIDEINVTEGGLFRNGKRTYDYLILGFTEYVTREEYNAYREFVASGGTLIIMDACNFLAEVRYYPPSSPGQPSYLSLVKGHGWEFNGTHAWKSAYHRWWDENKNWVASNYWKYWWGKHYNFFIANTTHPISIYLRDAYGMNISTPYNAHEENTLQNLTDTTIVGYWNLINPSEYPDQPVVAYQHNYVNGTVFHSGIMASDIISYDTCMQTFLLCALGILSMTEPSLAIASIYALSAIGGVLVIMVFFSLCNIRAQKGSGHPKPIRRASQVRQKTQSRNGTMRNRWK